MRMISLLTIILLLSSCSNIFYDYRDAQSNDIIKLPHDYRLFSSDGEINYVSKKQDYSPVVIESNITYIGWNDDFIIYQRVEADRTQWGIFNMRDLTSQTYSSERELNNQLTKLDIHSIKLMKVRELLDQEK